MDWSYIAGYFDGEGHVGLHRSKRGGFVRALNWYNTHRPSLDAMREFMGLGTVRSSGVPHGLGKKPQFTLNIGRKSELMPALAELIPRLIIKRDAAEDLLIHLVECVDDSATANYGWSDRTDAAQLTAWYYDEKKSFAEIGRIVGVSQAAVAKVFRVRGWKSRTPIEASKPGVPKGEETRRRIGESQRRLWADPGYRERLLAILAKSKLKNSAPHLET